MKKRIIAIAAVAVLIVSTAILIAINHSTGNDTPQTQESPAGVTSSNESTEGSSEVSAPFEFVCTDRLSGYPETDRIIDPDCIEVVFADAGTIRKEYNNKDNESQPSFSESSEQVIKGMNVTFMGENGTIQYARWSYNGFTYTISINSIDNSVSAEEMTDYIFSTR